MESIDYQEEDKLQESDFKREIFSKSIRAGKRTYFFDVKSTRNNEYYLTITESKRKFSDNGNFKYEKHKLFLYPEDFEKFTGTLDEIIQFITDEQPELNAAKIEVVAENNDEEVMAEGDPEITPKNFSDINFEDI